MTNQEADEKFERLSKQIDNLPDEPPVVIQSPSRAFLVASVVQLAFVIIALIGVVALVIKTENNRVAQCELANETRDGITSVLQESRRPDSTPAQKEFLEKQINKFRPIDCRHPEKTIETSKTTSTSTP